MRQITITLGVDSTPTRSNPPTEGRDGSPEVCARGGVFVFAPRPHRVCVSVWVGMEEARMGTGRRVDRCN